MVWLRFCSVSDVRDEQGEPCKETSGAVQASQVWARARVGLVDRFAGIPLPKINPSGLESVLPRTVVLACSPRYGYGETSLISARLYETWTGPCEGCSAPADPRRRRHPPPASTRGEAWRKEGLEKTKGLSENNTIARDKAERCSSIGLATARQAG